MVPRRLPVRARTADALTIGLIALTIFVAIFPLQFHVAGFLIRIRRWPRVMALAGIVALGRHWIDPTPSLYSRVAPAWQRAQRRLAALATSTRQRHLPLVAVITIPMLISAAIVIHGYDGGPYLRGDCPYYYWTARALFYDHSLTLTNQLPGGWRAHVEQISWSIANVPVPKHPVVLAIVSLPFIAAFGEPGALIFNLVQMAALVYVMYALACLVARPAAASLAVIATFAGSFLPHYVWNYSPDVCATLLLLAGTLILANRRTASSAVLGGLLIGAACVAKFPLVIFVPGMILLRQWSPKSAVAVLLGVAVPIGAFAMMNVHLFGGPFITSYDRIATLGAGGIKIYSQRASFDLPIGEGLRGQLFDPEHGLVSTSPVTLIALVGVPLAIRKRPRLGTHLIASSVVLFLLFSTYDQWNASHYGNRFLMPLVAACALPLAAAMDRFMWRTPGPAEGLH